jgi:hypothetical protein
LPGLRCPTGERIPTSRPASAAPWLKPNAKLGDIEELANPAWLLTHPDLRRTARIQVFMRFIGDAVASRIRAASDAGLRAA